MQCLEEDHLSFMRSVNESFDPSVPYVPYHRNEAYPSHLCRVNFRKLSLKSLMLYVAVFGINVRPDCTRDECATAVATHFVTWTPDEEAVMKYLRENIGTLPEEKPPEGGKESPNPLTEQIGNRTRNGEGRVSQSSFIGLGDVVAALANGNQHTDEGWILARVTRVLEGGGYEVQDEDDENRKYRLRKEQVFPLCASTALRLKKGSSCLAVFPDTTSFYIATVMAANNKGDSFIEVCFEEDLDSTDRPIVRRLRADYIIPLPTPKNSTSGARLKDAHRLYSRGRGPKPGVKKGVRGGVRLASVGASASGQDTYSNRIAHALRKLPDHKGSFVEICAIIEEDFSNSLNWKLESDVRRTPVWKSSVRKILISNQRFKTVEVESKHEFTFSNPEAMYNG